MNRDMINASIARFITVAQYYGNEKFWKEHVASDQSSNKKT